MFLNLPCYSLTPFISKTALYQTGPILLLFSFILMHILGNRLNINFRKEGTWLNLVQFGEITQSKQKYNRISSWRMCENLGRLKTFLFFIKCSSFKVFLFFFSVVVRNNSRKKTCSEFLNFYGKVCEGALSRKDSWKVGTEFEWTCLLVSWQGFISLEQDRVTQGLYVLYQ